MNKYARVCVAVIALAGLVWFIGHVAYEHRAVVTYLYTGDCIQQLNFIDEAMLYLVTGDCINDSYRSLFETDDQEPPFELRSEHTVSDLVREALRRDLLEGKDVCDMRGDRQPYLVFPVPASWLWHDYLVKKGIREPSKDVPEKVPVLMDPPGAHMESAKLMMIYRVFSLKKGLSAALSSRVLYSDGSIGVISREEAEKLVSDYSPMPLELDFESQPEADK